MVMRHVYMAIGLVCDVVCRDDEKSVHCSTYLLTYLLTFIYSPWGQQGANRLSMSTTDIHENETIKLCDNEA